MQLAETPSHYLALAIFQAAYTCPLEHVKNGVCSWITGKDVAALSNNPSAERSTLLKEAESTLASLRGMLAQTGIADDLGASNRLIAVFAATDIRMARLLLGKQAGSKVAFASAAEVARAFVADFKAAFPAADTLAYDARFPPTLAQPLALAGASAEKEVMPLYHVALSGETADVRARLRLRGFDIGASVQAPAGDAARANSKWSIADLREAVTALDNGTVILAMASASDVSISVDADMFLQEWSLADPASQIVRQAGWPQHRAATAQAARSLARKGTVLMGLGCLADLLEKHVPLAPCLEILVKPVKTVRCLEAFPPGSLVLFPDTTVLKSFPRGAPNADLRDSGHCEVQFDPADPDFVFWLGPCTSATCMAPLWFVASTPEEHKANMTWESVQVGST